MRTVTFSTFAVLASLLAAGPVFAQAKKDTRQDTRPASGAGDVRYFTSMNGLLGDQADVILKETRQGGRLAAATLDVCFPSTVSSARMDRFVLELSTDGGKLSGSTTTQEDKVPVTVNLTQKANGKAADFSGKITLGTSSSDVDSTDNTDIGEREFKDSQSFDDKLVSAPKDFTDVSPESVAVRVKRDAVVDFLKSLRGERVQIALYSLAASCAELRAGHQVIRLTIDPDRAAELIGKFKGMPGVLDAGWSDGSFDLERTIRFNAAEWREGGKLNRDKIAATISPIIATALGATAQSAKWNDDTGELTLTFKRQNQTMPALDLTDKIEVSALVSSDKPGGSDRLLLWVGNPSITTSDESSGHKLNLADTSSGEDDENAADDDGGMVPALAKALKAQRWDSDNSAWR